MNITSYCIASHFVPYGIGSWEYAPDENKMLQILSNCAIKTIFAVFFKR